MERKTIFPGYVLIGGIVVFLLIAMGFLSGSFFDGGPGQPVVVKPEKRDAPARILVYVAGAVNSPGVYEMSDGGRVFEAVKAAGGTIPYADAASIDMAGALEDGMRIYVPLDITARESAGRTLININTANREELSVLPGIGPVTADKIIDWRDQHGSFTTREDIMKVPSIGEGKYRKIENQITL